MAACEPLISGRVFELWTRAGKAEVVLDSGRQRKALVLPHTCEETKRNGSGSLRLLIPALFLHRGGHRASFVFSIRRHAASTISQAGARTEARCLIAARLDGS